MDFYYDYTKNPDKSIISPEEFMNFEEDTYDVLGSVFIREIGDITQISEHKVIDKECRFDLLSFEHMRSVEYWWILMEYNNFIDFGIQIGDKYKVPSVAGINKKIQSLIVRNNLNNIN